MNRLTALVFCLASVTSPIQAATPSPSISYLTLANPSLMGLGFLADGQSLYVGGCQPFDLSLQQVPPGCRFPSSVRWGTTSPDGQLLLATAIDPRNGRSTSYQVEALTGKVLSTRPGIHFFAPVAIHPSNNFWVSAKAGKTPSTSETLTVVNRQWRVVKRGIYANTSRVFSLAFSSSGDKLTVNGGSTQEGEVLNTATWKPVAVHPNSLHGSSSSFLALGPDGHVGARLDGRQLLLLEAATETPLARLDIDLSSGEPELAFSRDGQWFAAKGYYVESGVRSFGFVLVKLR